MASGVTEQSHGTASVPGDPGSPIERIEVFLFTHEVENIAFDVNPSGIDMPGMRTTQTKLATVVHTRDGARGEFVGGRVIALPQTLFGARWAIGESCFAREALYQKLRRMLRKEDRIGLCPIDNALWDLAGKRGDVSVSRLLGGTVRRLPAYASTWFGGDGGGLDSPEAFVDFAEECFGLGYRAFKMHGWTDGRPERDAEAIRQLGRRIAGRMALMHDSACHLRTFADALAVGRACDEAGFFWYEDPYSDGGLAAHAHRRLRQLIKTPLLLGEHVRCVESVATLVLADGTDFVRADPNLDMGITGTMKIAHLAEALGLDVELHGCGPAHRAAMSAIRNTNYYELGLVGPSRSDPGTTHYACDYSDRLEAIGPDGCLPVPEGPGLGVQYNWDLIKKKTIRHEVVA